jgi:hypothetical protein
MTQRKLYFGFAQIKIGVSQSVLWLSRGPAEVEPGVQIPQALAALPKGLSGQFKVNVCMFDIRPSIYTLAR